MKWLPFVSWGGVMLLRLAQEAPPIDWATISRLVPEAILVGFFMWFTLKRDAAWAQHERDREELRVASVEKREKEWLERLSERDVQWQTFLREEREWRKEALTDVAKELKGVNTILVQLTGQMLQHEAAVAERAHLYRTQLDKLIQEKK